MDRNEKQAAKNPRENAHFLSSATFAWIWEIFLLGNRSDLTESDLFAPLNEHSSRQLGKKLEDLWHEEERKFQKKGKIKPSLLKALIRNFGLEVLTVGIVQGINELVIRMSQPLLFGKVLSYFVEKNTMSMRVVIYWATALSLSYIIYVIIYIHCLNVMNQIEMKVQIACCSLIYRKLLKISKTSFETETTTGQIVNFISNDFNSINYSIFQIHFTWIVPAQLLIVSYIICQDVNFSSTSGVLVLFLVLLLQGFLWKLTVLVTRRTAKCTDERLRLTNEIVNGIKLIKMSAWEKHFERLLKITRAKEMRNIYYQNILQALACSFSIYVSHFALLLTLLFFPELGSSSSIKNVYVIMAYYNLISTNVSDILAFGLQNTAKGLQFIRRAEKFLSCDEILNPSCNISDDTPVNNFSKSDNAISVNKATANWSSNSKNPILKSLEFSAKRGSITAIVGQVASGKTSLLHLILRELPLDSGSINVVGKIAYVSQDAWIFSSSIRQNIIFTQQMDKSRYNKVIKVCQLTRDFALFPHKDQTIVGEKGINLSGVQRARIALARAVYSDADIYLLDDPLSAVDAKVGRRIFNDCICNFLKNKTRILATHQLQYLKNVDRIYILDKGSIQFAGTYQELQNFGLGFLKKVENQERQKDRKVICENEPASLIRNQSSDDYSSEDVTSEKKQKASAEDKSYGSLSRSVYITYSKACGSLWLVLFACLLIIIAQVTKSGADYYVSFWVNTKHSCSAGSNYKQVCSNSMDDSKWYIYVYSSLILIVMITNYGHGFAFFETCKKSSEGLHTSLISSIIHAEMSFFCKNPVGRILNRFSNDMGTVDKRLPFSMFVVRFYLVQLFGIMTIIIVVNFWLLVPAILITVILHFLNRVYIRFSRSIRRLDGSTRSPVVKLVSETLQGLTTVRAFQSEEILKDEFDDHQDLHTSARFLHICSSRALFLYSDFLCALYTSIIIFMFIILDNKTLIGNVGLIITQSLLLPNIIKFLMLHMTDVENCMISVERILEYTDIEQERTSGVKPPENWPTQGCVEFKNVFLRYNNEDAAVLKNLNFIAKSREKIGVVGRTGAGKSSLICALFRLAHLEGEIFIDGLTTKHLELHDLRSRISIISQQPLLFSGTVRRNLDPFEEYSDNAVWQALEEVELKDAVVDMAAGLDSMVSDGGSNFSLGQRQLLCLARAVVRNNKILILDEATANIDEQTEKLIHETIRRKFDNCTILIIAHSLETVIDCDKLMVMDAGKIVEFGQPYQLLKKGHGPLWEMGQQTGSEMAQILERMARKV